MTEKIFKRFKRFFMSGNGNPSPENQLRFLHGESSAPKIIRLINPVYDYRDLEIYRRDLEISL